MGHRQPMLVDPANRPPGQVRLLQAENDGTPSSSRERRAPSRPVFSAAMKSSVGCGQGRGLPIAFSRRA